MGKKKIDPYKFIENKMQRDVTYSKRKRGIIKKAIELSRMCGQDIFMIIFDKNKQKLVEYRSTKDFAINIVNSLLQHDICLQFKHEVYTNSDQTKFEHATSDIDIYKLNRQVTNHDLETDQDDITNGEHTKGSVMTQHGITIQPLTKMVTEGQVSKYIEPSMQSSVG